MIDRQTSEFPTLLVSRFKIQKWRHDGWFLKQYINKYSGNIFFSISSFSTVSIRVHTLVFSNNLV